MKTHAHEIDWLFGQCDAEMGLKSNFNAMIIALKVGASRKRVDDDTGELVNGVQEDLHNEDALIDAIDTRAARSRLGATRKNRRVMNAFRQLDTVHQIVFERAFEPRQFPPEVRQTFAELAGVAALTQAARAIRGYSPAWLARAISRGDPRVTEIRDQARALLEAALAAYAGAREAA